MQLHNLKPAEGSIKKAKRIGRGIGSGKGRTAARGHKGAKSRSGWSKKKGYEGGQMPLQQRVPKMGFKNPNRIEYVPLNLNRLEELVDKIGKSDISLQDLKDIGIIKKRDLVKILANGKITKAIKIEAHKCSENAKNAIEDQGGSINLL